MTKEQIIEKLKKVYELGKSHQYSEMIEDIKLEADAELVFDEMSENILNKI